MSSYHKNKSCSCLRCRVTGLLWAAVFITLGVLFLLNNYHILPFDESWPALLIVIGICMFVGRSASIEGHKEPYWAGGAPPASSQPPNQQVPHE